MNLAGQLPCSHYEMSASISSHVQMHNLAYTVVLRCQLVLKWISSKCSDPICFFAEQVIDSEIQVVTYSHDDGDGDSGPYMKFWLWVYEADMKTETTVHRSDMIWPNKQQEGIYICIGMTDRESDDGRCLSKNMTVIFTENLSKGHRQAAMGTQIRLPIKKFNLFLPDEEIETRGKICNSACEKKHNRMIDGLVIGLVGGIPLLLVICICLTSCCSGAKSDSNGSATSGRPVHGKDIPCPHSTIILKY